MNFAFPEVHQMKCSKFERAGRKRIGIRRERCVTGRTITGWKLAPTGCRHGRFGIRYENYRREGGGGRALIISPRRRRCGRRKKTRGSLPPACPHLSTPAARVHTTSHL